MESQYLQQKTTQLWFSGLEVMEERMCWYGLQVVDVLNVSWEGGKFFFWFSHSLTQKKDKCMVGFLFTYMPLDPKTMKNEGFEPPIYGL